MSSGAAGAVGAPVIRADHTFCCIEITELERNRVTYGRTGGRGESRARTVELQCCVAKWLTASPWNQRGQSIDKIFKLNRLKPLGPRLGDHGDQAVGDVSVSDVRRLLETLDTP
ncbi:hypothetical protein EVAR_67841_1 [Eumeta japonica]|uniref:Uncharacterized protein n=1 Tax=Eumeta variegata TaxID=151549 RepID=A0A4C2ADW1_EUMVA|nr:hypothetical protein EVAR_67841_1 [Eumeta japonica]